MCVWIRLDGEVIGCGSGFRGIQNNTAKAYFAPQGRETQKGQSQQNAIKKAAKRPTDGPASGYED
jgi:hypothetical protein